jgi:transposase-like protein
MTEDEAYKAFVSIRYAETEGQPYCQWCSCAAVYEIKTRRKFKCQNCLRQFSVTSQTIFAGRKMPFRNMMLAIAIFTNGAKGLSALELSRHMDVQYKTAYVLLQKLREAVSALQAKHEQLSGEVEMDGAYFGGYVKPGNEAPQRRDRRKLANQSGKRLCVVIMRERGGKSRPFICSETEGALLALKHVAPGSIIYADEAKDYDKLHAVFDMKRIDHSKAYAKDGVSTNQAESFFSRLRRAEQGTHHHIAGPYFDTYAGEMSWREDNRRMSNGEQFLTITSAGLHHPVSRRWKGYWQRSKAA